MPGQPTVREMRLVVTATEYTEAVHFYRCVLEHVHRPTQPAGLQLTLFADAGAIPEA